MLATKHEQILDYIENLEIGYKISVRQIAKDLGVSEGTAYRAIKDAEIKGLVSTIERVGTIRIETKRKENIEKLTFAEVVNIVDGHVLGGKVGLYKTLNKFVIGAMELDEMMRYLEAGNLLIVGNRRGPHEVALKTGAAVLVTGGFDVDSSIIELSDELELPVISTSYDTFTVATLINRAIYDQLIKKEIILVEDILVPLEETSYLNIGQKVNSWYELNEATTHGHFPVVDSSRKVIGVVATKDIVGNDRFSPIEKVMSKHPIVVGEKVTVAAAARILVWEGINFLPVVDEQNRLQGVVSRSDVLKALQMIQRQPQVGETIDDIILSNFTEVSSIKGEELYKTSISPQMSNTIGAVSSGVITSIIIEAVGRAIRQVRKGDFVVENTTIYNIRPVQIESTIYIKPTILEVGRKFGKVDVEIFQGEVVVGKALVTVQMLQK